jgi:hypothetical protein
LLWWGTSRGYAKTLHCCASWLFVWLVCLLVLSAWCWGHIIRIRSTLLLCVHQKTKKTPRLIGPFLACLSFLPSINHKEVPGHHCNSCTYVHWSPKTPVACNSCSTNILPVLMTLITWSVVERSVIGSMFLGMCCPSHHPFPNMREACDEDHESY